MYLEHFGLRQAPFRITPNTGFFFAGARRGPTLEALEFAILHDEGIIKVSGEVGSGKTMLCRMLLDRLPGDVDTVYLANPTLGPDDLLRLIAEELGISLPSDNPGVRLLEIQKALIARFGGGRRVVALVDEAHAMPAASLEQIRLLSNLETGNQKLLQIVLFGQPELDGMLARQSMRQLRDRITQHFRLAPLQLEEVGGYLDFRLRTAGYHGPALFSATAVTLLARASAGLTRRVNVIADKAMLSAYSRGDHHVAPAHVAEAIRDCEYPLPARRLGRALALGAVLLALGAAAVLYLQRVLPAASDRHAGAPPATAVGSESGGDRPGVRQAAPMTPALEAAPSASPQQDAAAASAALPSAPPPQAADEAGGTPAEPPAATPPADEPAGAGTAPVAPAALADAPKAAPLLPIALGQAAAALQADTPRWVGEAPAENWFLQLRTVDGARAEDIDAFIEALPAGVDRAELRIYVRDLGWGARVGIIYGDYATRGEALDALNRLPAALRREGAYPRQVKGLQ